MSYQQGGRHGHPPGLEKTGVRRHNGARSASIEPEPPGIPLLVGTEPPPGPGWHRLLLVESGVVRLEGGASAVTLLPRSLALLLSGSASRVLKGAGAVLRGCSFGRSLIDPLALGQAVVEELDLAGTRSATVGHRSVRLSPEEFREANGLFSFLEREVRDRKPGCDAMLRLKLMEAILILYRGRRQAAPADGPVPFCLEEVQRFLQERYADALTLPGIAARFGFNPSYFSRLFHRQAGVPLVEYINGVRIRRSCVLLKRTSLGVLEIALTVGYNNLSHFNRYFRKLVGMSPREYRAQGEK
ncbi:MAG: AraC family transcriptional regulator [Spirochaetes bacterium]|nr:AraC family transcriptional regulator [Spirochaetota bacterium]